MKRLILLLILFVNLQIVITHEDMQLFSYSTASAQHMTKEAGDNCQDPDTHLWYHVDVSDCDDSGIVSTPCHYCWMEFGTDEQAIGARNAHELACGLTIVECKYCHARVRRMDMEFHYGSSCPYWNFGNYSWKEMKNIIYASGGEPSSISGGGGHTGGSSSGGISILANQNTSSPFPVPRRTPVGRPAAAMAGYSYHDAQKSVYNESLNGWEVDETEKNKLKAMGMVFEYPLNGYKSELFVKKRGQRILAYALAFAGTDAYGIILDPADTANDLDNVADNIAAQYYMAYQMAEKLVSFAGGTEVFFIGHSLGGGLASLASMTTGCVAMVFNPAVVAPSWVSILEREGSYHGTSNIYGYIMKGDYVTEMQKCVGLNAPGTFVIIERQNEGDDPHKIFTMYNNLQ